MQPLNPLDNTLASKLFDLDQRLQSLERARQPYQGDYLQFISTYFTYSSVTRITVSEITPSDFFQIGDFIYLVQSGTTKYFYIFGVGTDYLDIYAGTDYTLANSTITEFGKAVVPNPLGAPSFFTKTLQSSDIVVTNCTLSVFYNGNQKFYMKGNRVFVDTFYFITLSGTGGTSTMGVTHPFGTAVGGNYGGLFLIENVTSIVGSLFFTTVTGTSVIQVRKGNGLSLTNTDYSAQFSYSYSV